ncbi:MAG: DoxX family membrane protein [Myxococcales bacterium]|nr:DoxX family membrane protein [Myxococcales bacterium]MCB9752140.1 DoxX family membrane protein [Myxococcales bacterium]
MASALQRALSTRAGASAVSAARVIVAVVFIAAALPKIVDPAGFAEDIRNYEVFPLWSSNLLAGVVPMLELTGAIAILTGWKRRGAALLLGLLTASFIALIASAIARDLNIDCGCFGQQSEAQAVGWPRLLEDVGLLALIVVAALNPKRPRPSALVASR